MSSAMRATKSGRRIARTLAAVALTLGVGLAVAAPAHAGDDWNGWKHGKHHKHRGGGWGGGWGGGYGYWAPRPRIYYAPPPVYYAPPPPPVYYAPPPVVYAPPPVYYGPPSFSVVVPLKF